MKRMMRSRVWIYLSIGSKLTIHEPGGKDGHVIVTHESLESPFELPLCTRGSQVLVCSEEAFP